LHQGTAADWRGGDKREARTCVGKNKGRRSEKRKKKKMKI
jgi:hypothetical protein